jgi:hypothetical protein
MWMRSSGMSIWWLDGGNRLIKGEEKASKKSFHIAKVILRLRKKGKNQFWNGQSACPPATAPTVVTFENWKLKFARMKKLEEECFKRNGIAELAEQQRRREKREGKREKREGKNGITRKKASGEEEGRIGWFGKVKQPL